LTSELEVNFDLREEVAEDNATAAAAVAGTAAVESMLIITRRVRPPNGGRNEANSW